jgi:hypothetical protein
MRSQNDFTVYADSGQIRSAGCNSISFINQGTKTAVINNAMKILPGQSRSISNVLPDIEDGTNYTVSFSPDAGGTQELLVITTTI